MVAQKPLSKGALREAARRRLIARTTVRASFWFPVGWSAPLDRWLATGAPHLRMAQFRALLPTVTEVHARDHQQFVLRDVLLGDRVVLLAAQTGADHGIQP